MPNQKCWVSMKDTFFSGWGEAEGKKAVFIYECESKAEAKIVKQNAINHGSATELVILNEKPTYPELTHKSTFYVKTESNKKWYTEGGISK
jgi:hypothetical protein